MSQSLSCFTAAALALAQPTRRHTSRLASCVFLAQVYIWCETIEDGAAADRGG
jgi:hypothetical protein